MNAYNQNGYTNRREYLEALAEKFGVPEQRVVEIAHVLGQEEDFDGLVYILRAKSLRRSWMNVTQNQIDLINAIAFSEFQPINGAEPKNFEDLDWVWADCVMDSRVDGGTFTSLVNAGLAEHNGLKGREACVRLTLEGFRALQIGIHG